MKTLTLLIAIMLLAFIASFPFLKKEFNGDNINITVSEDEKEWSISAKYPEEKTQKVQRYLDKSLTRQGDMSFVNTQIDGTIALDDRTNFYIKSFPGKLKIEFNRRKNSRNAYFKMKQFSEGLKGILTER